MSTMVLQEKYGKEGPTHPETKNIHIWTNYMYGNPSTNTLIHWNSDTICRNDVKTIH
jgi:hypothetical protein